MCFACGDAFDLELPLAPLLSHQCCYVSDVSDRHPTITLEKYIEDKKRRVEVRINYMYEKLTCMSIFVVFIFFR